VPYSRTVGVKKYLLLLFSFTQAVRISLLAKSYPRFLRRYPVTETLLGKLTEVNTELKQARSALQDAQKELARTLRMVDRAEESLQALSKQREQAKEFLDTVNGMLGNTITPNIEASKEKIEQARKSFDEIRTSIENLNKIPFVEIEVPDDGLLDYFDEIIATLEGEVGQVEEVANNASTFMNDTSYFLGGDFGETREHINNLSEVVDAYETKIAGWQREVDLLIEKTPEWINRASALLAVLLIWLAFSQLGLILHGLALWRDAKNEVAAPDLNE